MGLRIKPISGTGYICDCRNNTTEVIRNKTTDETCNCFGSTGIVMIGNGLNGGINNGNNNGNIYYGNWNNSLVNRPRYGNKYNRTSYRSYSGIDNGNHNQLGNWMDLVKKYTNQYGSVMGNEKNNLETDNNSDTNKTASVNGIMNSIENLNKYSDHKQPHILITGYGNEGGVNQGNGNNNGNGGGIFNGNNNGNIYRLNKNDSQPD